MARWVFRWIGPVLKELWHNSSAIEAYGYVARLNKACIGHAQVLARFFHCLVIEENPQLLQFDDGRSSCNALDLIERSFPSFGVANPVVIEFDLITF